MPPILQDRLTVGVSRLEEATRWVERSLSPSQAIAIHASQWMAAVGSFREQEDVFLVEEKYDSRLEDHRVALSQLIAVGEAIGRASRMLQLPPELDFDQDDFDSTLASLHLTLRCQHGPQNHPSVNKELLGLFDVHQPAA